MTIVVRILIACLPCTASLTAQGIEASQVVGRELIANGDFSGGDVAPWVSKRGTPFLRDGHLRVEPDRGEAKAEVHLGQGLSGRVLVYGGRVRVPPDGGAAAEVFIYVGDQDYGRNAYRIECRLEPRDDWQQVQLVVPVPSGYVHTIVGLLRQGGALEIDDWSARAR